MTDPKLMAALKHMDIDTLTKYITAELQAESMTLEEADEILEAWQMNHLKKSVKNPKAILDYLAKQNGNN